MSNVSRYVRQRLYRRGWAVSRVAKHVPGGIDLEMDLPVVIDSSAPIIYDVGANVGQSIEMFRRVFSSPRIVSFEPSEGSFDRLKAKYDAPDVVLRQVALGSRAESRSFREFGQSTMNSLLDIDDRNEHRHRHLQVQRVTTVVTATLDSERVEQGTSHIDLLKVDTQGFDLEVLHGARQSFAEHRIGAVLVELLFLPVYKRQCDGMDIVAFLRTQGFALVDFYERSREDVRLAYCTALFKLHRDVEGST